MEELILKLTNAINDFNKYLKNEYSSINKNFSGIGNSIGDYSIFTIVVPKLTDYKINKTFPRANFIMVTIDNPNDKVYLSVNALTKEKLAFRDGSKFEGIFSDLYLTYDFTLNGVLPKVQIYIGYNSKYTPITSVKIADIDSSNPLPVILAGGGVEEKTATYNLENIIGSLNADEYTVIDVPATIDGNTVKGVSSIVIENTDTINTLFFSKYDNTTIGTGISILAGEKYSIDFKPLSQSGFKFCLKTDIGLTANFSVCILYTYGA